MDPNNFNFNWAEKELAQRVLLPTTSYETGKLKIPADSFFETAEVMNAQLLTTLGEMVLTMATARIKEEVAPITGKTNPTPADKKEAVRLGFTIGMETLILLAILRRSLRDVINDKNFRRALAESADEVLKEFGFVSLEARQQIRANLQKLAP